MITTIYGDMDESTLKRIDGYFEDDNESTTWVEYYQGEELVHRSVNIALKKGVEFPFTQENIGG